MSVASPESPVVPTVSPGCRLAPAAIGRRTEAPQIVWVEDPTWCTENHLDFGQVAIEDIVHSTDAEHLGIGSFLTDRLALELYASVKADVGATDPRLKGAHVVLDDGSGEDAFLTEDMADEFADRLVAFAEQVRRLAAVARLANQSS